MNLAQQYARFLLLTEGSARGCMESDAHPRSAFFELASEANALLNATHRLVRATTEIDSVGGVDEFFFDKPEDLLDWLILSVQIKDSTGVYGKPLDRRDDEWAQGEWGDFSNPSGTTGPTDWWPATDTDQLGIAPPIGAARTGAVRIAYVKIPTAMSRLVASTTKKWTVTNGSAAFTFPATQRPAVGSIAVGDEIGSGTEETLPSLWGRIATLTTSGSEITGGTLTASWSGESGTATDFVAAQASEVWRAAPKPQLATAPVHYAIAQSYAKSDPQFAEKHEKKWLAIKAAAGASRRNAKGPDATRRIKKYIGW